MYEALDLYFTADGDFKLDTTGDLQDTGDDPYRSLRQEVATLVTANLNDWALNPSLGANLSQLIGRPNNQETAEQVQGQITQALSQGLLKETDFRVDVVPLDTFTLGVLLIVQVGEENGELQVVTVPLAFNLGVGIFVA
jgi:hypothetical protein